MKAWILSFTVIAAAVGTITWLLVQRTVPRMLANANEEMVADWREGLLLRYQETGTWPRHDSLRNFMEDVYYMMGADDRRITDGYMNGRPTKNNGTAIVDVFDTPLRFTFEGDTCHVASAGPNRIFGDADDVTSDTARDRYTPSTLALARAAAEENAARRAERKLPGGTQPGPAKTAVEEN